MSTNRDKIEKALWSQDPAQIDDALRSCPSIDNPIGDPDSFTPLEYAASHELNGALQHLLSRGAEPVSAFHVAARKGNVAGLKILLDAGVSADALSKNGETALLDAVDHDSPGHLACVKELIKAGANVNVVNENRIVNAVMSCAWNGSIAMMEALVAAGARLNDVWLLGTALTTAVVENQPRMVEWLLQHGADPSLQVPDDSNDDEIAGMTALEIAQKKRLKKIVAILESGSTPQGSKPQAASVAGPVGKGPRKTRPASLAQLFARLEKALKARGQWKDAGLRRPATEAQLAAIERKLGTPLPGDLRKAYLVHNGQKPGDCDLFPDPDPDEERYFWLSASEIVSEWKVFQEVNEEDRRQACGADPGVRELWWHPGWIPFASNGGGDVLCIDTSPAKGGKKGQVISVSHESTSRRQLASTFREFLDESIDLLDSDEEDD